MTSMNVSMPDTMRKYVRDRAKEQHFGTPTEYIRSLIREDARRRSRERLTELIAEAENSGPGIPITPDSLNDLRRRVTQTIESVVAKKRKRK